MRIIVIEDEAYALKRLINLIRKISNTIEVVDTADSIEKSIDLLKQHDNIDLLLMDIELADGKSFEIFKKIEINIPVIFTTAYDEFAIQAFKFNSIDYLLKPISEEELTFALNKFRNNNKQAIQKDILLEAIKNFSTTNNIYKSRFLVKAGKKLLSIPTDEICYFVSYEKLSYLVTSNGRYIIESTLEELEKSVNSSTFFRLNRQYLITISSVKSASASFNGKIKVELKNPFNTEEIIVSREKASAFKNFLDS